MLGRRTLGSCARSPVNGTRTGSADASRLPVCRLNFERRGFPSASLTHPPFRRAGTTASAAAMASRRHARTRTTRRTRVDTRRRPRRTETPCRIPRRHVRRRLPRRSRSISTPNPSSVPVYEKARRAPRRLDLRYDTSSRKSRVTCSQTKRAARRRKRTQRRCCLRKSVAEVRNRERKNRDSKKTIRNKSRYLRFLGVVNQKHEGVRMMRTRVTLSEGTTRAATMPMVQVSFRTIPRGSGISTTTRSFWEEGKQINN